jgi:putative DNA methylase
LQQARDEIWQSWRYTCAENADHPRAKELFDRHKLPAFHDPFAGGGRCRWRRSGWGWRATPAT